MASGQFLQNLSSGIFGRLSELQNEQETKDEYRRGEVLHLLAGLADKIEPESLPLLMGHIGDVMKLQGPMKKLWSAFSGMPDRGLEDQLGTKLSEITSGLVGSETARKARAGGDMARLFQPTSPEQQANRERRLGAERDLTGKIIFRDPRQEKIEEIEARYGAQLAQNLRMQQERSDDALYRQAERFRLQGVQNNIKYNQKLFQA